MTRNPGKGASAMASAKRAEGLARYRRDYEAGRVGTKVHSRSGRDLPAHRPRVDVDQTRLIALHDEGLSLRVIAKRMGLGLGTVTRALQRRSNSFQRWSGPEEGGGEVLTNTGAQSVARVPAHDNPEIVPLVQRTSDYIQRSRAPATIRAYEADWRGFHGWCAARGFSALPATGATLCLYLTDLAENHKPASLQRRLAAISQVHQNAGHVTPTKSAPVKSLMAGIRRTKGVAPDCKEPVLTDDIRRIVDVLASGVRGIRDRALLLLGFAGAFRRSELVALDVVNLDFRDDGLVVNLQHSKTDQESQGRKIGIPYGSTPVTCPVRAVRAWLDTAGLQSGPVFRRVDRQGHAADSRLSDRMVALIVKRYVAAIGKAPERFAGHSLRAGLATSAAIGGASERSIMAQTGHRSVNMVRRYIRDGSLFRDNAAAKLGL